MRGRGIAMGKVPKNPGMEPWLPEPAAVDESIYDLSQFYDLGGNGSFYTDWYSDFDPCNLVPALPVDQPQIVLRLWTPPILVVFGVFGNMLSAYCMGCLGNECLSSCLYLTLLSITEMFVLVLRSGNDWLRTCYNIDFTKVVLLHSNAGCEVYSFFTSFIYHLCSWLVVLPVAEMAVMCRDLNRAHKICSISRMKNTVLLTVFFVTFVNAHFFFTYALLGPNWDPMCHTRQCTFIPGGWGETFRVWLWPILGDNIFAMIGPMLSVLMCLMYILIKSHCSQHDSAENLIMKNHFLIDGKALCQFRIICIVMSIFFICTALPEASYNMYEFILEKYGNNENIDPSSYAKRELAATVGIFLRDLFLSIKVLIYAVCWNKFRSKLCTILLKFPKYVLVKNKNNKITKPEVNNLQYNKPRVEESRALKTEVVYSYEHCV